MSNLEATAPGEVGSCAKSEAWRGLVASFPVILGVIPFALVLAIFYFIILLPMRRRQKKVDEFLKNLKVGDKVITTGGLFGSITRLGDQSLQVASGSGVLPLRVWYRSWAPGERTAV